MSKPRAYPGITYVEWGYVIKPIERKTEFDGVGYPFQNIIEIPKGGVISGAKSQNDWSKFGTPDDIIRIYARIPVDNVTFKPKEELDAHYIFVVGTGTPFKVPKIAEKLTIVKESGGDFIWHIYTCPVNFNALF